MALTPSDKGGPGSTEFTNHRGTRSELGEAVQRGLAEVRATVPAAQLQGVVADLSSAQGAAGLIAEAPGADILVNNAGIYGPQPFFDISDADWEHYFQTNVMPGVRLARHYLN